MNNDDCTHGTNGCHALQEVQKDMIAITTEKNELKDNVIENKKGIKDINKILFKQAAILGAITATIQLIFKFWN